MVWVNNTVPDQCDSTARKAGPRLPLTPAQLGIWVGQQLDPESPAYWTCEAVELIGKLHEAAMHAAVHQAIDECEALHMRFAVDDDGVWQRSAPIVWVMRSVDISPGSCDAPGRADEAWSAAQRWMQADLQGPADLQGGPLFDTALLRLAPMRHLWVLRVHHIALDGYGYTLLARRVAVLYAKVTGVAVRDDGGPRATLAAVVNEASAYQAQDAADDHAFWITRLACTASPPSFASKAPFNREVLRLRGEADFAAGKPAPLSQWQAAAKRCGVDWAAWVLSACAIWVARHALTPRQGECNITLGLPVMGRLGSAALTVPCMAMNIVPLQLRVQPSHSVAALARQVVEEMRALRPHQRYRYEWLRHDLGRSSEGQRLFGPVINLMPFDRSPAFGALQARVHAVAAGPVEDISVSIAPHANGIRVDLEANPAAYDAGQLAEHRSRLFAVLDVLLSASPDAALGELFPGWIEGAAPTSILAGEPIAATPTVLEVLCERAACSPHAIAIEQAGVTLSCAELLGEVQRLAGALLARGVCEEHRVAILLPRSPQTIVALLAVLWSGGAYVPLDIDSPDARIAMVLADAQPALVITTRHWADKLGDARPVLFLDEPHHAMAPVPALPVAVAPTALAYIIYTSGSTGRPNGVMVGRDALAHFVAGARQRYAMSAADRVLQFAPLHFDASVEEIFVTLASGATLVLRDEAMLESLPRFLAACAAQRISVMDLPTAFWHELAYCVGSGEGAPQLPAAVRLVIIGGEAALAERVARWRAAVAEHVVLLNTYGPTETTVICTSARLAGPDAVPWTADAVPIGAPLPGMTAVVVDAALQPVVSGEAGELCMVGGALARGYFGRAELSATRFITLHALAGSPRAYRTGDHVRIGADGALIYLGRLDDEFKISGYRIDPAEVETALLRCPGVREAAVLGQVLPNGSKRLAAFVACDTGAVIATLRTQLAKCLPAPTMPTSYTSLTRLPRNANNKIDREALRQLLTQELAQASVPAQKLTATQALVIKVWREVLGAQRIDMTDDFFDIGGKSLQAIQVAHRLGLALQRELPVSLLFLHRTAQALAAALEAPAAHAPPATASDPFAPLLCIQPPTGTTRNTPPLFCVHPAEGLAWCYMGLAAKLRDTPLYGLQSRGITAAPPRHIDEVIDDYLSRVRSVQPHGPYRLLGWSSGGGIAHAMAAALQAIGERVEILAMMDAYPSDIWAGKPEPTEREALIVLLDVIGYAGKGHLDDDGQTLSLEAMRARLQRPGTIFANRDPASLAKLTGQAIDSMKLYRGLRHPVFQGDVLFFHAAQRPVDAPDWLGWKPYVKGELQRVDVDSTHNGMSQRGPLAHIGRVLAERLEP